MEQLCVPPDATRSGQGQAVERVVAGERRRHSQRAVRELHGGRLPIQLSGTPQLPGRCPPLLYALLRLGLARR
jgi:hypothetical protein